MRTHRVVINILIVICILMTLPPFMMYGTKPIIVAGGTMPLFIAWIFGWSTAIVVLLICLYFCDLNYENKKNKIK